MSEGAHPGLAWALIAIDIENNKGELTEDSLCYGPDLIEKVIDMLVEDGRVPMEDLKRAQAHVDSLRDDVAQQKTL